MPVLSEGPIHEFPTPTSAGQGGPVTFPGATALSGYWKPNAGRSAVEERLQLV